MKKALCVAIAFATLLMVNGCKSENDINENVQKNEEQITTTNLETLGKDAKYSKLDNVNCPEMEHAVNSYSNYFITDTGDLYKYDLYRLFSNEENCKKVEWDLYNDEEKKVSSLFEMKKNGQNYVYALSSKTSYVTSEFYESYVLNDRDKTSIKNVDSALAFSFEYPKFKDIVIYQLNNSKAAIKNHKLYNITLHVLEGNYTPKRVEQYFIEDIVFEPQDDEEIMKIINTVIITTKRVYFYGIIDNKCMKYADAECEWGYKENSDLSNLIDEISFIDDSHVVFKNGISYLIEPFEYVYEESKPID